MIGAVALDGFRGFLAINSSPTSDVFQAFVKNELVPRLNPGNIVIMDHLSAHRNLRSAQNDRGRWRRNSVSASVLTRVQAHRKSLREVLKDIVRELPSATRELFDQAVAVAMSEISNDNIWQWTRFIGYWLRWIQARMNRKWYRYQDRNQKQSAISTSIATKRISIW